MIRRETNAELRRVMMEIYADVNGPGKLLQNMGAELIAQDECRGLPRRLYNIDGERFILLQNGTLEPDGSRREYLLGADPEALTPHAVVARSYGRPVSKYNEAVRT